MAALMIFCLRVICWFTVEALLRNSQSGTSATAVEIDPSNLLQTSNGSNSTSDSELIFKVRHEFEFSGFFKSEASGSDIRWEDVQLVGNVSAEQRLGILTTTESTDSGAAGWKYIPNVQDKWTLVSLGKMCANAYVRSPSDDGWIEGDKEWEKGHAIGWQGDGLRGHVFVDLLLRVVIIAFKGTTTRLSVDGDDTVDNDRYNDNLLFSCCCAAESGTWAPEVCDCYSSSRSYLCSNSCVSGSLRGESSYYTQSLSVYQHVRHMYPMSSIWLTGHSLGGGIASLLGRTYNLPTITFCAPGEKLAGERLGIAGGAEDGHIYHVGNTADPIFMGACNGALAVCSVAGYALETGCHMGYECVYDTVNDNETVMSVGNHGIRKMVEIMEGYGSAPACERRDECRDCFLWDYEE